MAQETHSNILNHSEFVHGIRSSQCDNRVRYLSKQSLHYLSTRVFEKCCINSIRCVAPSRSAKTQIALEYESDLVYEVYRNTLLSDLRSVF